MADDSIDKQKLLIEAIVADKELFARCQNILDSAYFHKQYQRTIKFILTFAEQYKAMPSIEQLTAETGIKYQVIEGISDEHRQYFLDEVEEFCKQQALTNAILKGSELIEKGDGGGIEKLIKEALLVGLTKDIGTEYFNDPRTRLMKIKNSNGKISTGWQTLDQKLYQVNRGELMIFCAPSGGGKSVALQNLSVNMASQGYNCVYITLELSEELVSMRLDSMITGVKSADIFKRLDDVELNVVLAGKNSGKITIKKFPSGTTTRDIKSYLNEYSIQKGFRPDVILVDYLDLMGSNSKISADNISMKDRCVSEELRALADEYKMLVATASQLNRSAVDTTEFNHAHIAGGLSKIQTADNVIGIFNSARSRERGEIEFQILKSRNSGGVDSKLIMDYNIETLRIIDLGVTQSSKKNSGNNIMDRLSRKSTTSQQINIEAVEEKQESKLAPTAPGAGLQALLNKHKN